MASARRSFCFETTRSPGKLPEDRPGRSKPVVLVAQPFGGATDCTLLFKYSPLRRRRRFRRVLKGEGSRWANRKLKQYPSRYCD